MTWARAHSASQLGSWRLLGPAPGSGSLLGQGGAAADVLSRRRGWLEVGSAQGPHGPSCFEDRHLGAEDTEAQKKAGAGPLWLLASLSPVVGWESLLAAAAAVGSVPSGVPGLPPEHCAPYSQL